MSSREASSNHISVGDPPRRKLNEYRSREVAEELCLMDSELLRKIDAAELQNGAWMKKDKVCGGGEREREKEGERERRRGREKERERAVLCPSPAEILPRPQHHGDGELLQSAGFTNTL